MIAAAFLASTILLLGGCAQAPKKQALNLSVDIPSEWTALDNSAAIAAATAEEAPIVEHWWLSFVDSAAAALVEEALAHNHDLQTATKNVAAARAQAKMAGAPLWPQVRADGSATRTKRNFIGFPIPGATGGVSSTTSTTYNANLVVSWEADLWGRLRSGQSAALADVEAAKADWHGTRQSLAAQTLRAYFAAIEARRQFELAESTVASYAISTDQVRSRYERGLRPSLDLLLSRSSLSTAEANMYGRQRQLDVARRQLELLVGRYPAATLSTAAELPRIEAAVPSGLPAELIGRRPDLVAAERRLAASHARYEEARATLYPRISLTASGGRSNSELGDLLDGDFGVWNLVGNLTQPLFQGGRLRAGIDLASARADGALIAYARSALRAFSEVETNLAAGRFLSHQERALAAAARHSSAARMLAEERYAKGLTDLLTMLTSQRNAYDAESRLLSVRRQLLESRIDLHLALGGGFADGATTLANATGDTP